MGTFYNELMATNYLTETENGAGAYSSTGSDCLDAFGKLGAMRNSSDEEITDTFMKVFDLDREIAMRMLFYFRDIRGGQGERRTFRVIMRLLAMVAPEVVEANYDNFLYFGRGDDLLCLMGTYLQSSVCAWMRSQIESDLLNARNGRSISLLAKWLPSENTSSQETRKLARAIQKEWGMSAKQYRQTLSTLRRHLDVVEVKMSANQWGLVNYNSTPGKATMTYGEAFYRHDEDRYSAYLDDVAANKAKVNANALYPADIISKILENCSIGYSVDHVSPLKKKLMDALWRALPNYLEGVEENALVMADTSGSMNGLPLAVSIGLAIYNAQRVSGPFENMFMTFDSHPHLQRIDPNDTIYDIVAGLKSINSLNTDIEAAFDAILNAAIRSKCKPEDMPSKLYIISDMQFDAARGVDHYGWHNTSPRPFMQDMKAKFEKAGYVMPAIVYWNVRTSNCGMFQDTFEGENCCMVSGYSPSLFKAVIEGTTYEEEVQEDGSKVVKQNIDPLSVMINALYNERYDRVRWAI